MRKRKYIFIIATVLSLVTIMAETTVYAAVGPSTHRGYNVKDQTVSTNYTYSGTSSPKVTFKTYLNSAYLAFSSANNPTVPYYLRLNENSGTTNWRDFMNCYTDKRVQYSVNGVNIIDFDNTGNLMTLDFRTDSAAVAARNSAMLSYVKSVEGGERGKRHFRRVE